MVEKQREATRLTAEELDEARKTLTDPMMWCPTKIPLFRKLLAAAEECERLRAAIEKHKSNWLKTRGERNVARDHELWEVLK